MEAPEEFHAEEAPPLLVQDAPKFDLDSYIANYVGRTKFDRLLLIGLCSTSLAPEALKAAVIEAKDGSDVQRYVTAVNALQKIDPTVAEAQLDREWMAEVEKQNAAETDRLEQELKGYKNNLIKESIRMGNEDLGSHYHQIGDLSQATKSYGRMRDFCTTPAHIASMSFRIMQVSIDRGDWLAVMSNIHKVRNLQVKQEDAIKNEAKINAAHGLSHLAQGQYHAAAEKFLHVDPALTDSYNEVLTSNDVAVYGGLCALASMDRNELQGKVLESVSFRQFLEMEPHIRRAISFFCARKFRQCLEILESYKADYLLDIHLQNHVQDIYSAIRNKSIVAYFIPFSRVTLSEVADVFFPNLSDHGIMDDELVNLIERGLLNFKIDLEDRVLIENGTNVRMETYDRILETLQDFEKELHIKILTANARAAGLVIQPPPKKGDPQSFAEADSMDEGTAPRSPVQPRR